MRRKQQRILVTLLRRPLLPFGNNLLVLWQAQIVALDPLPAAVCSLAEIESMFDELWDVERPYLQEFE